MKVEKDIIVGPLLFALVWTKNIFIDFLVSHEIFLNSLINVVDGVVKILTSILILLIVLYRFKKVRSGKDYH
jgi:hypothetical protein